MMKRLTNIAKWLMLFFDVLVHMCKSKDQVVLPCSAYFLVDTRYDVALMTDVQKAYVGRQIMSAGTGCLLAFFGGFLGCFGSYGPDAIIEKIKLPGF